MDTLNRLAAPVAWLCLAFTGCSEGHDDLTRGASALSAEGASAVLFDMYPLEPHDNYMSGSCPGPADARALPARIAAGRTLVVGSFGIEEADPFVERNDHGTVLSEGVRLVPLELERQIGEPLATNTNIRLAVDHTRRFVSDEDGTEHWEAPCYGSDAQPTTLSSQIVDDVMNGQVALLVERYEGDYLARGFMHVNAEVVSLAGVQYDLSSLEDEVERWAPVRSEEEASGPPHDDGAPVPEDVDSDQMRRH